MPTPTYTPFAVENVTLSPPTECSPLNLKSKRLDKISERVIRR